MARACLLGGLTSIALLSPAFAQQSSAGSPPIIKHANYSNPYRPSKYLRDQIKWNHRGRTAPPEESPAALRLRAYRQKMAMRAARLAGSTPWPFSAKPKANSSSSASTGWSPLGPAPLASDATGDGMQNYNWVSGRATSVLIDPADSSGNTVLLGGAYGGLWRSTNAGSQSTNPASVLWQPLIDDQPTLAVGAIALRPGNSSVIVVGTGETNNTADSYYGLGILRSTDGGATWQPPIQSAATGQSFLGIGFSKIAFSIVNPNLVVAAAAGDNGLDLGLEEAANSTAHGLYSSLDGGVTWNRVTLTDGAVPSSATSVIYNRSAGTSGTFFAFIQRHGLYSSTDGQNFTPLPAQPSAGMASVNCPTTINSTTCLIFRGEIAVVPGRNEMYVWVVDVQTDASGDLIPADEGIWQSLNGGATWTQILDNGITNCGDSAFGLNSGCGVEQGWYNLALAAIPDGTATDIYAGAVNLYKCTLAGGATCTQGDWINLTHVYGCNPGPLGAPAQVHPDQHGVAFTVVGSTSPGYFAHDGGISRTLDGYGGLTTGSCTGNNQFDSLSQTLGSMTQFVSVAVDPANPDILLGGTQANGSPKTSTATTSSTWQNALGGDGAFSAINPTNPSEWFAAEPYLTIFKCEAGTACDDSSFEQIVGPYDLGGDQGAFNTPYILDPQNPAEMLVGTCRVWLIGTSGTAPLQLSNDFDTLGTGLCTGNEVNLVNALAAGGPQNTSGDSEAVYAVTNGYGPLTGSPGGEVWVTTDAGVTLMSNVTGNVNPNGYAIGAVAMDASDIHGNTAYIGIMGFSTASYPTSHVWQTTNAGAGWVDWSGTGSNALPDAPVNALLVDSAAGQIYAGTDVGVFVSSTATASWTEVGPTPAPGAAGFLPNAPVTSLQLFNPASTTKTLIASTYGRGIWSYALITTPDFALSVSADPSNAVVNQNVTWNGTLQALNGYTGKVALSCTSGAPSTCAVSPASLTPTIAGAAFTVTLGSSTTGTFTFTIQGTDGTLTNSTPPETLTVETGLTWILTSNPIATVLAGQSAIYAFSAAPVGGAAFSSNINFDCAGLPALTNCVFNPASLAAGAGTTAVTLTITTAGPNTNAAAQFRRRARPPARAQAACGKSPRRNCFWVAQRVSAASIVPLPTADLAAEVTSPEGQREKHHRDDTRVRIQSGTAPHSVPRRLPVSAIAWALAAGFLLVGKERRAKPRLYICIVVASLGVGLLAEISCGGLTGSSGGSSGNFAITMTQTSPSTQVNQNITWNGMLTASNGYSGTVTLSCTTGAPATCVPSPQMATPTAAGTPFTLTLGSTTPGTFTFTISGTDGTLTNASPTESLTVTAPRTPDFAIAVTPTPNSTIVNQPVTWHGTLTTLNSSSGTGLEVNLSCAIDAPAICSVTPAIQNSGPAPGATYSVTLGSSMAGTFNVTIQGTAGSLTNATPTETLTVGPIVAVAPSPVTLFADETGNAWPAAVTQQQFTATVNGTTNQSVTWAVIGGSANGTVSATGLYTAPAAVPSPPTVTVTATSSAVSAAASASVTIATPTPLGSSQITVNATPAGGAAQSAVVKLVVQ